MTDTGIRRSASAGVTVVALLLVGPFMGRIYTTFGYPLGPPSYREGLSMQRHDPPAVLINALRIGASTPIVPSPPVNAAVAHGVMAVSRAYAATALGGLIVFATVLKWQIWGNRLVLPALVLGAPLAGWWLARMLPGVGTTKLITAVRAPKLITAVRAPKLLTAVRAPKLITAVAAVVVTLAFAGGYGSALFGWPRRLIGHTSVFVTDPWEQRFIRMPGLLAGYRYAADRVEASGVRRVGMYTVDDGWEYPWWRLLPGRELVTVYSLVPGRPATPITSVDAFVCAGGEECLRLLPPGWRYESVDGWVGVGLPVPASGGAAALPSEPRQVGIR